MNYYILYKLTFGNPKSRLEFIKDVLDYLSSESRGIVGDPVQPPPATKKANTVTKQKRKGMFCVLRSKKHILKYILKYIFAVISI